MVTVVDYLASAVKGKPADCSDVKTLEEAIKELSRLRRVTSRVVEILSQTDKSPGRSNDREPVKSKSPSKKKPLETSAHKKKKKPRRQNLKDDDASYKDYKKAVVPKSDSVRQFLKEAIQKNPLFKGISGNDALEDFVDVFSLKQTKAGSTVVKQGDRGEDFYIVESGSLDVYISVGEGEDKTETQVGLPLSPGMGFGELSLIYDSPRAATVKASEDCLLWAITKRAFKGLRLQHEQRALKLKLTSLRNVKVGEKIMGDVLSARDLESMALAVKSQSFAKGDVIIREGEEGDVFYVITKGSVVVSKQHQTLATLGVNSFFGEKALLSSETRNATCIAGTDCECLTLLRDDFVLLLGNFEDILSGKKLKRVETEGRESERTYYTMDDLEKRGLLGQGAFGKVNLVRSKKDNRLFALKAQGKAFIVENEQQNHTIAEYKLLREINHPLIVKMYRELCRVCTPFILFLPFPNSFNHILHRGVAG